MAAPDRARYGVQRIIRLAEAGDLLHVRRIGQSAVELVSPGMVRTLDASGELAFVLGAQQRAAMAADVVERADLSLLVAGDDHAGVAEVAEKVIARIRNLRCAA